jgi:hypothetical protein
MPTRQDNGLTGTDYSFSPAHLKDEFKGKSSPPSTNRRLSLEAVAIYCFPS